MSKRKCAFCGGRFDRDSMVISPNGLQAFCSKEHFIEYAAHNRDKLAAKTKKIERKRWAEKKREFKLNDKSLRLKAAEQACNAYVRARDKDKPCVSCGRTETPQWDAGHFRPKGSNAQLRFNELNIHKQCSHCNQFKSGNLLPYREELIRRIGLFEVYCLELSTSTAKYDCAELLAIEQHYKKKLKRLNK